MFLSWFFPFYDIENNELSFIEILNSPPLYDLIKTNAYAKGVVFSDAQYIKTVNALCAKIGITKVDTLEQIFVNKNNALAMFAEPSFLNFFNLDDRAFSDAIKSKYALWAWCSKQTYMSGRSINYAMVTANIAAILTLLEQCVIDGLFSKSSDVYLDIRGYIGVFEFPVNGFSKMIKASAEQYTNMNFYNVAGGKPILNLYGKGWTGEILSLFGVQTTHIYENGRSANATVINYTRIA